MPEIDSNKAEHTLRVSVVEGVFATVFVNLTTPFLVAFAVLLGANNLQVGLLVAALALFTLLGQVPSALLVESRGKRKQVAGYGALVSRFAWLGIAVLPIFFIKDWFVFLLLFVFIHGLFSGISALAWISWMGDLVDEKARGKYFGMRNYVMGFATIGSLVFSVFLLSFFSSFFSNGSLLGLQFLFIISCVFALLCFFLILRMYEPQVVKPEKPMNLKENFLLFLKTKNFKLFVSFLLLFNFGIGLPAPFWDVYILKYLNAASFWIPINALAVGLGIVFSLKFWGPISDKYGSKAVLRVCALGIAIIPFFWIFVSNPLHPVLINLYGGIFWGGFNLAVFTYQLDVTPKDRRPIYIALFAVFTGLPMVIAPAIGGLIAQTVAGFKFFMIDDLKLVFLISVLPRLVSLFFLRRIEEPRVKEVSPKIVFMEFVSGSVDYLSVGLTNLVFLSSKAVSIVSKTALNETKKIINVKNGVHRVLKADKIIKIRKQKKDKNEIK